MLVSGARQVLRKAQKSNATKENAFRFPATWAGVLAVLPGSPSHDLAAGGPPKDEVAIFAQTLMAGAVLDQAKVLCPLLENELLRQVWWTGMKHHRCHRLTFTLAEGVLILLLL